MANISDDTEVKDSSSEDEKILDEAHAFFALVDEAESENRKLAKEDLDFLAGNQWDEGIKSERSRDGRPCLVINKMPQFLKQITNDQRQNRPSIKVHPIDDDADVETAKVIQGLIRHIEYNSNAEVAIDTAFDGAAGGGFGYFRIITEYSSPDSFEQDILFKRIPNQFAVYFDPHSKEPDGSDATRAGIVEDLSPDAYKARYPSSKMAESGGFKAALDSKADWMPNGSVRVAEYFYKEFVDEEIVLLSNGQTIKKSEFSEGVIGQDGMPIEIVKERTAQMPKIMWVKLNGTEVLEKTEWPGKYIPIIPVYGNELQINGKRILESVIRHAKDPARMYNYWASAETEAIALAPRTPFIMAEGQDEGYEADWASANRRNHSVLKYKPISIGGVPVGAPQRNSFEPAVQAITQARMLAADDIKATTGIYDAALGNKSNETSGVAIQRRNIQAQTSNFHFVDNLTRSLKHTGRILIDLIPKIYDTARTARIVQEDGEQKVVKLNEQFEENGKPALYALDAGKYDVTVDVGPSFQSKRQEAVSSMLEMTRAVPQIMQVAGDILVKNMDWPGATDIAERIKKSMPPNLVDDPKASKELPPQVQQQMHQMSQMVEQLTGRLHELQDEKEMKLVELESKERIEFKKLEVQLEIKRAELDAKDSHALLSAEIDQINQRMNLLSVNQPYQFDEQGEQQMQPEQEQYPPQNPNGGQSADQGFGAQEPTGGYSPGSTMEGNQP